jgi:uncharacterized damage-inducible protein DinB
MTYPLVTQLWFARSEFARCLEGVSAEDALRRIEPMNCLSWIVGHLASQEQYLWLESAQGKILAPDLHAQVGYGSPPSTPSWEETWDLWRKITKSADEFLTTITEETLCTHFTRQGKTTREDVGKMLLRNIDHYWFHTGEAHAIRQMLGHERLPQFVGDLSEIKY